ncbi:MAG TPA: GTPase HflX, partial [Acidobacteria bacterium]|nr:GTPase HflX [Acidobacteriota bacterium]
VGYTNAGKTTLFNQMTGDDAVASDALFVTLDPLVRRLRLPDRRVILCSDTVGFIDRLPHALVAAFRATLEEVAEADLLLHVCDASSPDRDRHVEAVRSVLAEIGADEVPCVMVWNKCDQVVDAERRRLVQAEAGSVALSALDAASGPAVLGVIEERLGRSASAAEYVDGAA